MRQKEIQDEEERMQKRQEISSSSSILAQGEVEYSTTAGILSLKFWWLFVGQCLNCSNSFSSLCLSHFCATFALFSVPSFRSPVEGDEIDSSQDPRAASMIIQTLPPRQNRYRKFLYCLFFFLSRRIVGCCYKFFVHL